MAVNVGSSAVVKLIDNVLSEREVTVRNDGAGAVFISRDPQMVASGADTFNVAANTEQEVSLEVGQALYAICAAGVSAAVEVI